MVNPLVVNVAELLRHPGSRRIVEVAVSVADMAPAGLAVVDARVPAEAEVVIAVELESLSDGVIVTGRVEAPWEAECRRCLSRVQGRLAPVVRELYRATPDPDDDAFPLAGDQLDLTPLVREGLALDLPLAPLCRDDCAGLCPVCGADLNQGQCGCDGTVADPRWAALDALRDQFQRGT